METLLILAIAIALGLFILSRALVIIRDREAGVCERLGRFHGILQPGFHLLIPFIDRVLYRFDLREQSIDIPTQTCITRDNVQVTLDAKVHFQIVDPFKAAYGVADYTQGISDLAATSARALIATLDLHSLHHLNTTSITDEINDAASPWGIQILQYELKGLSPLQAAPQPA